MWNIDKKKKLFRIFELFKFDDRLFNFKIYLLYTSMASTETQVVQDKPVTTFIRCALLAHLKSLL